MALNMPARGGQTLPTERSIHPAWIAAAVTFLTLVATAGFRSAPSVLIVPLEVAFGWSRAQISLAISVNVLLFGFTAPFAAALMERFGIRRVVMAALTLIGGGAAATVFMTEPWHLVLLWGVVVGVGTGSMALVFVATRCMRWWVPDLVVVHGRLGRLVHLGGCGILE